MPCSRGIPACGWKRSPAPWTESPKSQCEADAQKGRGLTAGLARVGSRAHSQASNRGSGGGRFLTPKCRYFPGGRGDPRRVFPARKARHCRDEEERGRVLQNHGTSSIASAVSGVLTDRAVSQPLSDIRFLTPMSLFFPGRGRLLPSLAADGGAFAPVRSSAIAGAKASHDWPTVTPRRRDPSTRLSAAMGAQLNDIAIDK